jgi:acyl-CoA thioesterase
MDSLSDRVVSRMMQEDAFSKWLGIEVLATGPGTCALQMVVTADMLNGFHMAHGGISYALADSCLAFAANGHGIQCVSVETSISHTAPTLEGDELMAEAIEEQCAKTFARYRVHVWRKTDQKTVALFKGTVFRTGKAWFSETTD